MRWRRSFYLNLSLVLALLIDGGGQAADEAKDVTIRNAALAVTFRGADGTLSVEDLRTQRRWEQRAIAKGIEVVSVEAKDGIRATLRHAPSKLEITATVQLDGDKPEFVVALSAKGKMPNPVAYPHPFVTEKGSYLVVPMNEGISYPVEDETIKPMRLIAYGGHGICMGFWGATDGKQAMMAIIETPDDAGVRVARAGDLLCLAPDWESQRGEWGYERRLRYVFFDKGDHVAMCKRYRGHAKQIGLFKTLEQKRRENPNVDLLVGAVNVWCWERDAVGIAKEMQAAGIERILWSNRQGPDGIRAMNAMPMVLTSRYDIYQDVMNPENFKLLRGVHSDWPTEAWPKDIMLDAKGDWRRGWEVTARDGSRIPCGVLCDMRALDYAKKRIPPELQTHDYRCRFIDTTTASPWRECYNPDHPMTRSESKKWKMELLRFVSEDMKLVTGSETGHEASVPYVHYFEGMLSLGYYRVPDAGRRMQEIWETVPENVAKFQVGQRYRLPLWELVYHDCVVAQWYWGDYNNKLPALWDKRDLFNALYGTPPMFMFNRKFWESNKERFVQSYRATCPIARATGYSEMTDHRFLTPDRDVQQTVFANGVTVTVNFGEKPFKMADGTEVKAMGCVVKGM
ncbi:MAG: glycoside hydrolase [Candidatus Sumerlaeia bacterium]|nr:glycoside hydrolase [Candidatus Sumerlaeia bacterium]